MGLGVSSSGPAHSAVLGYYGRCSIVNCRVAAGFGLSQYDLAALFRDALLAHEFGRGLEKVTQKLPILRPDPGRNRTCQGIP